MIEILFDKSREFHENINEVDDFRDIYTGISLKINGQSVAQNIEFEDFFPEFVDIFLRTCLSLLPDLYSGQSGKFELEGPFELIFEPKNSKIIIYLHFEEYKKPEKMFEVELKDFAHEVIKVTEEFTDYVFKLRQDLKKHKSTKELLDRIEEAKSWYFLKYKEKI
ncbi:hypothetical protein METP2_02345 [Methanosarcinales archaeon]|nr:hypothetical protein [Candidatus Methanoperedens sp.]CAG0987208.1 hypothetical protein METP2_02345 [Methanosarcinales archaeon]